jgi:hypothetical protein
MGKLSRSINHIVLSAVLIGLPISSHAEPISVGSCPDPIDIEKRGEWRGLQNESDLVASMQGNPQSSRNVAAVYVVDGADMLEVTVISLRSLEPYQGRLSEADFKAIRREFANAFKGPSPEMQDKIDRVVKGNLNGTGMSAGHLKYEPAVISPGMLVGHAVTEVDAPEWSGSLFHTALKMQYLRGCIVQANFSVLVSPGSRDRLNQAIDDFVMK